MMIEEVVDNMVDVMEKIAVIAFHVVAVLAVVAVALVVVIASAVVAALLAVWAVEASFDVVQDRQELVLQDDHNRPAFDMNYDRHH